VWTALWAVYIIWGSTYLGIRLTVETLPPLLSMGFRYALGGLILATIVVLRRGWKGIRIGRRELAWTAVIGTLLLLGGNGLVAVGEDAGLPSGLAALLIASEPLFVVLLRAATRDRPAATTVAGLIAGFVGVAILLLPSDRPEGATAGGIALVLLAAALWATGSFASTKAKLEGEPLTLAAWQLVLGGLVMALVGLTAGEGSALDLGAISLDSALALAYLVLFGTVVAFTAYTWLLRNAPISKVSTYAYVNPIVAVALGALIVGEEVTATMVVGAAIIVASVAAIVRREGEEEEDSPPDAPAIRRSLRLERR
jgi:drug/metabolite transporter (DMT)-like permease